MTFRVIDEVEVDPTELRVYAEGWQSWSPTTWYTVGRSMQRPTEPWQHTMRFRPGVDLPPGAADLQGEGLVVVDPGNGDPARRYASLDVVHAVVSIRVAAADGRLVVSADGDVEIAHEPDGPVRALTSFGDEIAARAGAGPLRTPPSVWCSWYRYFEDVTARDIEENVAAFDAHDLPVEVVQIDDGWSHGIGEWLRPTHGFPTLPSLVDTIRSTGRRAGIWLAPFLVGVDTDLARRHPDWLIDDAGHNWGQDLVGLDLTHPGVRDYLDSTFRTLRETGFDYFKLDFLYAGASPGERHADVSGIDAYRSGLAMIRDAVGPDAYLVGCGAPILASVGFFDAMRVSPDTYHEGGADGSEGLRGRMSLVARAWQHGRFWTNDPDCLITNPAFRLREEWADTVRRFGGLRSFSDRVVELDPWGLRTIREILGDQHAPDPFESALLELSVKEEQR